MVFKTFSRLARAFSSKFRLSVIKYVTNTLSARARATPVYAPYEHTPNVGATSQPSTTQAFAANRDNLIPLEEPKQNIQDSITGNPDKTQVVTEAPEKALGKVERLVQMFEELDRNANAGIIDTRKPLVQEPVPHSSAVDVMALAAKFGVVDLGPSPTAATDCIKKDPLNWEQRYGLHAYKLHVEGRLCKSTNPHDSSKQL